MKYIDRKMFGIRLAILASPKAIGLIALDTVNCHRRPSGTQSNKVARLK
jgi:hypothetical protein